MHVADKGLQTVGDKFYRPPEHPAKRGDGNLVAVDVQLDPETAADIRTQDPDPVFVDAQMPAVNVLLLPRRLM